MGAAVDTLLGILNGYQEWRDNMPAGVSDSAAAQRFDDVLALRDLVEQLQGVDLPTFQKSLEGTDTNRRTVVVLIILNRSRRDTLHSVSAPPYPLVSSADTSGADG